MRLLLDTHIFLWLISGDARLSGETETRILSVGRDCIPAPEYANTFVFVGGNVET